MRDKFKKILFIMVTLIIIILPTISIADVGNFESYDSSWDSSYDSDWGSSYDSDWDSSYGGGYSTSGIRGGNGISLWFAIIIFIIVFTVINKNSKSSMNQDANVPPRRVNNDRNTSKYIRNSARSQAVAEEVRKVDESFNDEKFLSKVKNDFIKLQTAWSERDWESIRPIESEALFEQHSKQLKDYINRKQINKMERISVNFAELTAFVQNKENDILVVALNSSMIDYIEDEKTGNVLRGSKDYRLTNTYKLTFIRKKGIATETAGDKLKTTNCPNCGAPTVITSSGRCEYCGSVIVTGNHDWVLNNMERF